MKFLIRSFIQKACALRVSLRPSPKTTFATAARRNRRFLSTSNTPNILRTSSRNYKNTFYKPCSNLKRSIKSSQSYSSPFQPYLNRRSLHVYAQNLQQYNAGVEVIATNNNLPPVRSPKQVKLSNELSKYSSDVANNIPVDIAGFSSVSAHTGTNANVFAALNELGTSLKIPNPKMALIGCGLNPITAREDSVAIVINGNASNINYGIAYVARDNISPFNFGWTDVLVSKKSNKNTVSILPRPKNMENYEFVVFAEFGLNGKDYRIGFKNSLTANQVDGGAKHGDSQYRGDHVFLMKQLSNLLDYGLSDGNANGKRGNRLFDLVAGDFSIGPPYTGNPIKQEVYYWSPGYTSSNGKPLDWFVSKNKLKQRKEFGGGIAKAKMSPGDTTLVASPTGTSHRGIGIDFV